MPTSETANLERLDALEAKVSQAASAVETLTARCRDLTQVNQKLQDQVADLTNRNDELTREIERLKVASEKRSEGRVDDKRILSKIDRMIEKFGELQV
jgi:FtsZ-binding cell division protein ZapB